MKFKLDENMPVDLVDDLCQAGHEADTVRDEGLVGAADPLILARVAAETRILLTMDKGIADVRAYVPQKYAGLILFRPHTAGRRSVLAFARHHLPAILRLDLKGRLLIVSEAGIRIR